MAPAQPVLQQPVISQAVATQQPHQIDSFATGNPYGFAEAGATERPYVPFASSNNSWSNNNNFGRAPVTQVRQQNSSTAIGSVVVGAIAFCLSLVGLMPGSPVFYYSAGGVLAVIGGARALLRRRQGAAIGLGTPVAAIILGSLAVICMLAGILIHTSGNYSGTVNNSSTAAQSQVGSDSGVISALPAAPTFATDPALSTYEQSAENIAKSIYTTYSGGQIESSAADWPTTLTESTTGTVTFPSGIAAATIPTDEVLDYRVSSDGKYFALSVSGGSRTEVAIYDSKANEFTWECGSGAAATCPVGGLSANSSSSSGSNT